MGARVCVYIHIHICNKRKYKKEVYNPSTESNHT